MGERAKERERVEVWSIVFRGRRVGLHVGL